MKSSLLEHYKKKYGTGGKIPVRKTGMWYQDGDVVVPSNEITMEGPNGEKDYFDSPIMGIGLQSGKSQVMLPGENYFFPEDDAVLEKKMQSGGEFLLGAASFAPPPYGTAAGLASAGINLYQGDLESFGWDMAGVLTGGAAKWFKGASQAAKAAGAGRVARNMGDKARFFQTASNPNIYKTIGTARDYPNYNTPVQRTPQRESTYVAPRPRPIMQKGAKFKSSLNSVSPQGNINYGASGSLGSIRGRLSANTDVYNPKATSVVPSLSVGDFSLDYSPEMLKASYEGNKVRGSVSRASDKKTEAELSLMLKKFNLDANATLDKETLKNIGASANYQLAPNLSLYGNVNYTPNQPAEYGVGFTYKKQFDEGGEVDDDDDDEEMVEGIADILKQVKDKKNRKQIAKKMVEDFEEEEVEYNLDDFMQAAKVMQKGGFRYTPPPRRTFTTSYQQPTRSTSDNTRVVTSNTNVSSATRAMVAGQRAKEAAAKRSGVIYAGTPESNYKKAKKAASFVEQSKLADGFATPLDYVLDTVNPTQYVFNATDLVGNQVSAVKNLAQGNFQEAGSDLLEAQMNALSLVPITKAAAPVLKPVLKQAARYGDDVIQTSKIVGRPTLPKYKDVYRAEHAGFNQTATPQDITGRWAANSADEASYYVQNLKDPTTGKVMNAFSGEQAPVRIMKQRVPEYKYNQQFAEGMPEEARIMSMGPGRLSKTELDQVLGPGATKRFQTNQFSNQDLAAMQTAPFLYNPNEGILDADIINSLRQGKSTLGGKSLLFSNQNQAADYLLSQSNFGKKVSPLNKYLPFNTFQMGGMSIPGVNGNVVSSMPTTIRDAYKKKKKKK